MKKKNHLKISLFIISTLMMCGDVLSQDCKVSKESLAGTYSGDCKKGKADGKGKAIGTDTYEGEFKSGLPNGEGIYTWKNGNVYSGHFSKGMMDGKGHLLIKRPNTTDSIVDGYWKKDMYTGKYESPYKVYSKGSGIDQLDISYKRDENKRLIINVSNTSAGAASFGGGSRSAKVDNIIMFSGSIGRMDVTSSGPKNIQSTVYDVLYPARMKIVIGADEIEVEFYETGTYTLNVNVNR